MKKVSKEPSDGIEYTHRIRITLPYEKVVIDDKKEIKAHFQKQREKS